MNCHMEMYQEKRHIFKCIHERNFYTRKSIIQNAIDSKAVHQTYLGNNKIEKKKYNAYLTYNYQYVNTILDQEK